LSGEPGDVREFGGCRGELTKSLANVGESFGKISAQKLFVVNFTFRPTLTFSRMLAVYYFRLCVCGVVHVVALL